MKQYEKRFYFDQYTLKFYSILLYNTNDPLFSDSKVRQALTYAINRNYIVNNMLNSYAKVAVGPMGVDSPFRNPKLTPLPYDPQKSQALLHQAGWSYDKDNRYLYKHGIPFEFTLLVIKESQIEKKVVQYIKLCLNDIGIKMNIRTLPYDMFAENFLLNNTFQAVFTEFTGAYLGPEFLKEQWVPHPSCRSDTGYFEHAEVTHLLNQAIKEKDQNKQKEIMHNVDALIVALQPGTFLFHKTAIDVMSRRFTIPFAFSLSHEGIYRLRFAALAEN